MAIIATVDTIFGESRELYIRINSVEANNHASEATALFRGFLSKEAFEGGANYVMEEHVSFLPDVSGCIWTQAYVAIKEMPAYADAEDA